MLVSMLLMSATRTCSWLQLPDMVLSHLYLYLTPAQGKQLCEG
jgi:hypothetical protein